MIVDKPIRNYYFVASTSVTMSDLKSQVKEIMQNFENTDSSQIILVLHEIKTKLRSNVTQEYLEGKISKISQLDNGKEKSELVNSLKPYLEWYLQGA